MFKITQGNHMSINLRRAAALQKSIQDTIHEIPLITQIKINEFQDPEAEIAEHRAQLERNLQRRSDLTQALYEIRTRVGEANRVGVDQRLTEIARLDREIQDLQKITQNGQPRQSVSVLSGQLTKIRDSKPEARMYGYDSTVETSVVTSSELDYYRRQIQERRRQRQRLQDEILELNVKTEIDISDSAVTTLSRENLI
jgi:hypothetical protein